MSLGFTYKGIHSFDKHVEIIDIKPPLFPQNEGNTESVSGRIGAFILAQMLVNEEYN